MHGQLHAGLLPKREGNPHSGFGCRHPNVYYILMMKLTVLLILAFTFQVSAFTYAQRINLHVKEASLADILKHVQRQSGYNFLFNNRYLKNTKPVTVDIQDKSIEEALSLIFADQPYNFQIEGDIITLIPKTTSGADPAASDNLQRVVQGQVTDSLGTPLEGVSVLVQGTSKGVATDSGGRYQIAAAADEVLVFRLVGYGVQTIAASRQSAMDVVLLPESADLDEVVVVGYGTQRKVNLTGSVSSVNFEKGGMQSRPLQNVSSALAGMAAGLNVNLSNGHPGAPASVKVRGVGSLNAGQDPLIVIDGQVGDINAVNPSDVASVSVLKDAASAAIYGSRASNGVILVTTKTGQNSDGKVSFNYNGNVGKTDAARVFDIIDNTVDQMELINLVQRNSGIQPSYSDERINEWREGSISDPLLYPNTNWWDALLSSGIMQTHNLSARGGNSRINFFTSMGYLQNGGTIPNTGMDRYNFRNNLSYKVNDWLELGNILTALYSESDPGTDGSIFQWFETLTPGTLPKHPDGRYGLSMTGGSEFSANNPLRAAETQLGENATQRYTGKFFAKLTPLEGLTLTGSYFVDFYNYNNWTSNRPVDTWDFQTNTIGLAASPTIGIGNSFSKNRRSVVDLFGNYERSFGNHHFTLLAGYNQEYYRTDAFSASKIDLYSLDIPVLDAAATVQSASGNANDFAMRSYFGRLNYSFDDRYLLEVNIRTDGSSRFSPGNRWGTFPSASAGWNLSNESFWAPLQATIDQFKLRASYGRLGNNGIGNYDWQSVYRAANYSFNGTITKGLAPTAFANAGITWETTDVMDIGMDMRLFQSLSLSVDYYNKLTHGILARVPIPFVNGGLEAPLINSAKVRNSGVEAEVSFQKQFNAFSLFVGLNGALNNNVIESYKGDYLEPHGQGVWTEGQPIGKFWLRQVDHIVQDQAEIDALVDDGWVFRPSTPGPGDFLYRDADGNKTVDDNDRTLMGNPLPKFTYGGTLNAEYKGFDLLAQFNGVAGWDKYLTSPTFTLLRPINGVLAAPKFLDSWTEDNPSTTIPKLYNSDPKNNQISDYYLQSASYFRIKALQLGYTLPATWVERAKISNVRLYVNLENYFTFTGWEGLDPESGGVTYPQMKTLSFGLNFGF